MATTPWIRTVPAEGASGPLKELFDKHKIQRVMTNNGPGLAAVSQLNQALRFGPSAISRVQREMIAAIGEQDRVMLRYTEKLTLRPGTVEREDVEALRVAGFSDPAIGDIAAHVALFSFMNRIVDGLGGQLEGDMAERARRYGFPLHPGTFE